MNIIETVIGVIVRFFKFLKDLIVGSGGGALKNEYEKDAFREALSDELPWAAYDPETHQYLNTDNTAGYLWECIPLAFCSLKEAKALESLMRLDLPAGAVMQFMLYSDRYVDPILEQYKASKTRQDPAILESVASFADFLRSGTDGMDRLSGIPVRNFRLFVAVKSPEQIPEDILSIFEESLKGANLAPRRMAAEDTLEWLRRFLNHHVPANPRQYNSNVPLRKQVIYAETDVEFEASTIKFGSRHGHCLTPMVTPKRIDRLETNGLSGGIMGMVDDAKQITSPFLWTLNVVYGNLKNEVHTKASLTMMQKAGGTFAVSIQKRVDEFLWALNELEGGRFIRVMPVLWVFGQSEKEARDAAARARRIWEGPGYIMQDEVAIAKAMFKAALPFGLVATPNNIKILKRDFMPPMNTAVNLLPTQADFIGSTNPVLLYLGRKGQLVGIDLFDKRVNNHNFLITAGSGAGKSFSLNYIISNYYGSGAKIRAVDLGRSYRKLSRIVKNGRFLDIGKEEMCINPFDAVSQDIEDEAHNMSATATVVAEMVYSASGQELTEVEWTLIKDAVRWAKKRDGGERGVDHVQEYLRTFPKYGGDMAIDVTSVIETAKIMAYNLRDFTSAGIYGKFFNGKSTFQIKDDDFVILELEDLKTQRELFKVMTLQICNAVTQDLYLSELADRDTRRFCLFDEAWQYFGNGARLGLMIEEGYRRARKYGGAFGLVTQSMLDLKNFGPAGTAIRNSSAFKFLMESDDYPQAVREGLLDYSGLKLDLLLSVKNRKPLFSEMFADTPFGCGVVRLAVDRKTYWVNTSAPEEVARFETLMDKGYSANDAIAELARG